MSCLRSCLSSWAVFDPVRDRVLSLVLLISASTHQCNQNLALDLLISEPCPWSCMWSYAIFTPPCDRELFLVLLVIQAYVPFCLSPKHTSSLVCRRKPSLVLRVIRVYPQSSLPSKFVFSSAYDIIIVSCLCLACPHQSSLALLTMIAFLYSACQWKLQYISSGDTVTDENCTTLIALTPHSVHSDLCPRLLSRWPIPLCSWSSVPKQDPVRRPVNWMSVILR